MVDPIFAADGETYERAAIDMATNRGVEGGGGVVVKSSKHVSSNLPPALFLLPHSLALST
jgi:hypothetical protein